MVRAHVKRVEPHREGEHRHRFQPAWRKRRHRRGVGHAGDQRAGQAKTSATAIETKKPPIASGNSIISSLRFTLETRPPITAPSMTSATVWMPGGSTPSTQPPPWSTALASVAPRMSGAVTPSRSKTRPQTSPDVISRTSPPRSTIWAGGGRLKPPAALACMTLGSRATSTRMRNNWTTAILRYRRLVLRDGYDRRKRAGCGRQQRVYPGPARDIVEIGPGREHDRSEPDEHDRDRTGIARGGCQRFGCRGRADQHAGDEHGRIEPGLSQDGQRPQHADDRDEQHRAREPGGGNAEQGEQRAADGGDGDHGRLSGPDRQPPRRVSRRVHRSQGRPRGQTRAALFNARLRRLAQTVRAQVSPASGTLRAAQAERARWMRATTSTRSDAFRAKHRRRPVSPPGPKAVPGARPTLALSTSSMASARESCRPSTVKNW